MAVERLVGDAAIDTEDPIAGTARMLGWQWKTDAAGKRITGIFVRVPASGAFAAGCRAQWWTVNTAQLEQSIDIGGLSGTPGAWVRVPGLTAADLTQNALYWVTVYHPSTDGGNYYFKSGFGDPANGSLSGQCIFRNGDSETTPPNDLTFTQGAFGVDVEIDDAAGPDTEPPTAPSNLAYTTPASGQIQLTWDASSDNVGVTGYDIYANGFLRGQVSGSTLSFLDSQPDTLTVTYTVRARDAAGNVSADSNSVTRPGSSLPPPGPQTTAQSVLGPLQKGIYDRLTEDATLLSLASGGVHDQVPEDKSRPFVQIGDAIETPHNSHDRFGREVLLTLVVWDEYAGFARAASIVNRIVELVDHQRRNITVAGHRLCSIRLAQAQPLRDPDPRFRQIPVAFRAITEQL